MTVYDDADSRGAAWKKFVDHPDWHKLKAIEKIQRHRFPHPQDRLETKELLAAVTKRLAATDIVSSAHAAFIYSIAMSYSESSLGNST